MQSRPEYYLKQVVLKGKISEPTLSRLTYHGPGIITAKDIEWRKSLKAY